MLGIRHIRGFAVRCRTEFRVKPVSQLTSPQHNHGRDSNCQFDSECFYAPNNLFYLSVSKELQQKILRTPRELIKFRVVEHAELNSSSSDDIVPAEHTDSTVTSPVYLFAYNCTPAPEASATDFFAQFRIQLRRKPLLNAYGAVLTLCSERVARTRAEDKVANRVVGDWSGYEVDTCAHVGDLELLSGACVAPGRSPAKWVFSLLVEKVSAVVNSRSFNNLVTAFILLNTFVLSLDHYGISPEFEEALYLCNVFFTVVFAVEMVLKLVGLGPKAYFKDSMNYFDTLVVLLSVAELSSFSEENSAVSAFRTVRIFRTFRVLRIARLFRYLEYMTKLLSIVGKSVFISLNLALILLIFTLVFALLGMQLFGGRFDFAEGRPRAHFDDFHWAFVTIFQILSLEDWNSVLYDAMRSTGPASALFFIVWIVVGNFVLLNIFLAILLESFGRESEKQRTAGGRNSTQFSGSSLLGLSRKQRELIKAIQGLDGVSSNSSNGEPEAVDLYQDTHCERSFFCFSKVSRVRKLCALTVKSAHFETLMLLVIVVSSLKLVLDIY